MRRFWPESVVELANRTDRESHLVVADWLEEHGCEVAAIVFRDSAYAFWRNVLAMMASSAPEAAPRGDMLTILETSVLAMGDQHRQMANRMPFGVDMSSLLGEQSGRLPRATP